jgi:hypothetical protein
MVTAEIMLGVQRLRAAAALLGLERRGAGDAPTLEPAMNRVLAHAQSGGDGELRVSCLEHGHRPFAQHLQRRIRDRPPSRFCMAPA